ncbi:ASCH/PUA domain-containing protein [Tumebacillus permanentifrigoris]|uniref:Uncharacterized protein DUF3850 n=1 Tax=Tumebacillus permanentifrigoris TaxID=378543 RepID=A0A316DPD0_9BACL|nr:ASCH/PUA domain-containing protein [Tumebacillus permanentifrigoris]PWK03954.1 uncharacterized protein DUF3850 [Tumebacillus permanentifrigoris]
MIHELKLVQPYFDAVASGQKTVEMRWDDRGYQVDDTLVLREYDPATDSYSGRTLERQVTHILRGEEWGVMNGYCALSIKPVVKMGRFGPIILHQKEDGSLQLRDNLSRFWCACGAPAVHQIEEQANTIYEFLCIKHNAEYQEA